LHARYVKPFQNDWSRRPVAAILVREPGPNGFSDGVYKAYLPELSKCQVGCTIVDALFPLNDLPPMSSAAEWQYWEAHRRLNLEFSSVNTGEIILLANLPAGFQFGQGYNSQHGSLTRADAVVPVAFGYPGGAQMGDKDTVLEPIRQLFGGDPPAGQPIPTLDKMLEAPAIRSFFRRQ
jgi:hypothetical protein